MVERVLDGFMAALLRLLGLALIGAVLLNFANVIGRYVYGSSILWADEVEMVVLVVITFLGASIVGWRRQHLVMDLLLKSMPPPARIAVRLFEIGSLLVISALACWQSCSYALQMFRLDRTSDNAGIPMWLPHGSVALGFALLAIVAIWHAYGDATSGGGRESALDGSSSDNQAAVNKGLTP